MTSPAINDAKVSILLRILSNVATLLSGGALGLGDTGRVVALLQFAGSVVRDMALGSSQLRDIDALIKRMVDAGRGPTEAEWAAMEARLASVDARFAAVKAIL